MMLLSTIFARRTGRLGWWRTVVLWLMLPAAGAYAQTPTISGFAPSSGITGTNVTISGTDLDVVRGVRFGTGSLTTNFVSQSATSLTVVAPVNAATGVLTLTTSAGVTVSSASAFTYILRPMGMVATLSPAGPLDACAPRTLTATATKPGFSIGAGFSSIVYDVVVQPNGKLLVGGDFTTYDGAAHNRLIRLNADGTRDPTFSIGTGFNNIVNSVALQADGKVLVGGNFTRFDGAAQNYLIRLNADGTRDNTFAIGTGFNGAVGTVVLQSDGKVLVSGAFTSYDGVGQNYLTRLNADGTRDNTFTIGTGFSSFVYDLALQPDGKVLAGGIFGSYNGASQQYFIRLNADGTRDATLVTGTNFNNVVRSIAVDANGKVLVGGEFTSYNGTTAQNGLIRLNANGSRDATFTTGTGFNGRVLSVAVQPDGKVLAGGQFTSYNGLTGQNNFIRLNTDGTRDAAFTTGTGFTNPASSIIVRSVAVQVDGKVLAGGQFTYYDGVGQSYLTRLNADGSRNGAAEPLSGAAFVFSPGGTSTNPLVTSTLGTYSVVASLAGETSAPSNAVTLLTCPTLTSFTPGSGLAGSTVTITGTDLDYVRSVRFGSTGLPTARFVSQSATSLTVVVPEVGVTGPLTLTTMANSTVSSAGTFTYQPRVPLLAPTLSPTGPLDACAARTLTAAVTTPGFTGTGLNSFVYAVAVQADGKVLVGGSFTSYNGTTRLMVARLHPDGSLDNAFAPTGTGLNGQVNAVAVQADGKVLVGGQFTTYDGTVSIGVARLHADGSLDATFVTAGTGFSGTVRAVAVQADGKVLVGCDFIRNTGTARTYLVRLHADGSLDATFAATGTGFNSYLETLAVQTDGKVLVGGTFTSHNGTARNYVARLHPDGSLDVTFAPAGSGLNNQVKALAVQADGKVLVGGTFTSYNSTTANRIARLHADGSLDATFAPSGTGLNSFVLAAAVQADGKVLVGGRLTSYNGTARNYVARLNADGTLDASATTVSGATFTFSPGGTTTNPLVTSTPGTYTATASYLGNVSAASNAVVITPCPPSLTSLSTALGPEGTSVTITGTGFTGVTAVHFNGTPAASFVVTLATALTATVPAGATTGAVTVTSPGGTSNGLAFEVLLIFAGTANQCLSTTPVSSTGSGQWQYLRESTTGHLVAALNDQGHALGTITADVYLNQGAVRPDGYGREYLDRNWHLTAQNAFAGQSVLVRFYGLISEFTAYQAANDGDANDVTSLADLRVTKYDGPNQDCQFINNGATGSYMLLTPAPPQALAGASWFGLEVSVADHFSEFYLNGGNSPLPVELVAFTAERRGGRAVATAWRTASEHHNAGFVVERATDGRGFAAVSTLVAGQGTSTEAHAYEWVDQTAPAGRLYYRLRQLDADGTSHLSAVVTVAPASGAVAPLGVHPNPATTQVTLTNGAADQAVELLDAVGRVVLTAEAGTVVLDVAGLPAGVYVMRCGSQTQRLAIE